MKKIILVMSLTILSANVFAEMCPNVNEIKNNKLTGWKAYDSDDGKPLSVARETAFKKMIEEFALAEWVKKKSKMNTIHCYYRDKTGSSLEAYFAKNDFAPKLAANNFWYDVSGYMHCAAGMDKCEFEGRGLAKNQLAKK